ncbi:hypothetical protein ASG40_10230 [Methylobacterium sp. Leaf399]|nr:hypothetical protein ASG40_10230 [Methylobacterium sp. Leaf399]
MRTLLPRATLTLALLLAAPAAHANPPVDETKAGLCLELKVDGQVRRCNHDFRLVDDGQGEITLVTGYDEAKAGVKTVVAFATAQAPAMENAYGYALRLTSVTLMPVGNPDSQRHWPATGLCFVVKPNPVRAGTTPIKQDIVILCTAHLTDTAARVRRFDWKFVF